MKVFIGLECVVVVCTSYWTWGFAVLLVLCACWPRILAQIYIIKRIKKKKNVTKKFQRVMHVVMDWDLKKN